MRSMLTLLVMAVALGSASAQDKSWVGELILPTKETDKIKIGDVIDGKQVYFSYSGHWPIKVRNDKEGWLRIHDGHREGWVDKADFVLAKEAPAYFHRRERANPKDEFALFMRGVGWLQKGEPDNAIKDFDECIRLDPTEPKYYNSRAIADYHEGIRLDSKESLTFANRGLAWSAKKDYDKAIKDFDEAIRLDPKNELTCHRLAWFLATCPEEKMRNGKRAVELGKEVLDLDKKNANRMSTLAAAYAEVGNFEEAVRWQERALQDPELTNDADARRRLELYRKKQPYRQE